MLTRTLPSYFGLLSCPHSFKIISRMESPPASLNANQAVLHHTQRCCIRLLAVTNIAHSLQEGLISDAPQLAHAHASWT